MSKQEGLNLLPAGCTVERALCAPLLSRSCNVTASAQEHISVSKDLRHIFPTILKANAVSGTAHAVTHQMNALSLPG